MSRTRQNIGRIIFQYQKKDEKTFDIVLLFFIFCSVLTTVLDSIPGLSERLYNILGVCEIIFTILFTIEYILRVWSSRKRMNYIFSFYGLIDLLSVLPTYLLLFNIGLTQLATIRVLRLLRILRIIKLARMLYASNYLYRSLISSIPKITVFLGFVGIISIFIGSLMYVIENGQNGFESIPQSIYWVVVTLTTVGYGDIVPVTPLGKFLASIIMILGYGIIAVPTGIISSEIVKKNK